MQITGVRAETSPPAPLVLTPIDPRAAERRPSALPFAFLLVISAAGVAAVAVAFAGARSGRSWAEPLYWAGLLVIVLPITLRLAGPTAQRSERLALVVVASLGTYLSMVMLSPDVFPLHDELGAYRSIADILRSHQLYVPNSVDLAYSSYPGLPAVAAAMARLSGVGIVPCGLFLIAVAKLLLVCGIFFFLERVTHSARIAGIGCILYMANPNFVFFDSQVAYESLALGLGAVVLWLTAQLSDAATGTWTQVVGAILVEGALVLTHHLTSYAIASMLLLWTALSLLKRPRKPATKRMLALSGFAVAATVAYLLHTLHATENDIGGSIVGSFTGLIHIISGQQAGRAPFHSAPGYTDPALERMVGIASVALLTAGWPFGLYAGWRERKRDLAIAVLSIAAFMYPASLALRLSAAGNETSNRTSEFVFLGLAAVLAVAFVTIAARRVDGFRWRGRLVRSLAVGYVGIVFAGGITVGAATYDLLPGPYQPSADVRSVDTEGVAAAKWAARSLPAPGKFLADITDNELISAYTRLDAQSGNVFGVPVGQLFVSPKFGPQERRIITFDKLRYLVVDERDSRQLPRSGRYFEEGDPTSYASPISRGALTKFDAQPCISRIFSSGNIVIYDTSRILRGCG